jgi:glutaredoxin
MEKCSKNAYKLKEYLFPSGKTINIQGYEHYALDELIKEGVSEEDIKTGSKNVPELWYDDEIGKRHRHYVDIYIPSQNRCIEVKSTWTAEKKKDCIFLKQNAGKKGGFDYEIWVYNQKGKKINCYI